MTVPYCTKDDVYLLALPAQAFVIVPRPVNAPGDVDAGTATIRLQAHGLSLDDVITFPVTSGGDLPTGISAFVPYYPVPTNGDLFRVATASHATPIASWASAGRGWQVAIDSGRRLDRNILAASAFIDEHLVAQAPPILPDPTTGKLPDQVVALCARIAAYWTVTSLQITNAGYRVAIDRIEAMRDFDGYGPRGAVPGTTLGNWLTGKPILPKATDQTTIPDNGARAVSFRRPVAFTRNCM